MRAATVARLAARTLLPTPPFPPPTAHMRRAGSRRSLEGPSPELGCEARRLIFNQLGVPVRRIDDTQVWPPLGVSLSASQDTHNRGPPRLCRPSDQAHSRLHGCTPALASIAIPTAAHHVLPRTPSALRARNDVIEIQLRAWHAMATVLTGVRVPRIDVHATEAHVALWNPVESPQQNHAWYQDQTPHYAGRLFSDANSEFAPGIKVKSLVTLVDRPRGASIQQAERSAR